jgi:hypothetical protein
VVAELTHSQDQQLTGLAAQVELLARLVNSLTAQVASLSAELKRLQGG